MRVVAAALVVALAAWPASGVRAEGSRRVEFTPIPDVDAAHVANPHDHRGTPLCQRCHVRGETAPSVDPIALCAQCHDKSRMKHPYGVVQRNAPADLPLAPGGVVACHTCHDPHDVKRQRSGLRLAFADLCLRCHQRHRAKPASAK